MSDVESYSVVMSRQEWLLIKELILPPELKARMMLAHKLEQQLVTHPQKATLREVQP